MEGYKNMIKSPLISIIIPTYNRAHIIDETLDSIIAQTHTHWECIVVDDGSTDGTAHLMAGYMERDTRFRYYHRPVERPKGPCSCRNYGFEQSKGDYVNFFDSDDLLKPMAFEKSLNSFKKNTDAVVMNTASRDFKTGKNLRVRSIHSVNLLTDYFIGKVTFLVCGPVWRRSFLDKQPYLFDELIGHADDWDFNLRMLYSNPKLILLDDVYIYYRIHSSSFSNEIIKLNKKQILSDLNSRDKHWNLIKNRVDCNFKIIKRFIINRNKRYVKSAIVQEVDAGLFSFFVKKLISRQIKFKDYSGVLKSCLGYISVKLTGRGYSYFNNEKL